MPCYTQNLTFSNSPWWSVMTSLLPRTTNDLQVSSEREYMDLKQFNFLFWIYILVVLFQMLLLENQYSWETFVFTFQYWTIHMACIWRTTLCFINNNHLKILSLGFYLLEDDEIIILVEVPGQRFKAICWYYKPKLTHICIYVFHRVFYCLKLWCESIWQNKM